VQLSSAILDDISVRIDVKFVLVLMSSLEMAVSVPVRVVHQSARYYRLKELIVVATFWLDVHQKSLVVQRLVWYSRLGELSVVATFWLDVHQQSPVVGRAFSADWIDRHDTSEQVVPSMYEHLKR
jgi:hypothetical protein